ncbi:DUF4397 domain-containing protein [Arthrobacter sp. NEB 688]|uniref:DUF4397 domain-containing protein n=1 Tax=Arthrobacter sp. NEB 688 TaxID=904039 RepID=UPI001565B799|nr:DUF4397 domain-containing protein [Arthrobacter sp. NEB 688]QKE83430.1 DUF4397 domain-containing protein [Arthrobacter sp. NEB 688]
MRRALAATAVVAVAALPLALTTPAYAADDASVVVVHGVPGLTVDVYGSADTTYGADEALLEDFEPGTVTDPVKLPAGTYNLAVFPAGDDPSGDPAIEATDVEVPAGANISVVAHLDADGNPTLTPFVNDVDPVAAGQGRLVVRHTAAAPAVDVLAGGEAVFSGLTNPNEDSADLPAGTVSAAVALAGTTDPVIGPADVDVAEGTSTIVYAYGSAEDDTLALAVQTIGGLHSSPSGVPSGTADLPADTTPALLLGAAGLATLAALGMGLRARRSRV